MTTAVVAAVAVLVLTACESMIVTNVNTTRATAALPSLPVAPELTSAARAKSVEMCAAGGVSESADPLARYGGGTALAADELVAVAVLDPGSSTANADATTAIWAQWQHQPTVVDPKWDAIGVGEHSCADGRLFMTLVLRDSPIPGLRADGRTSLFLGQELGATGGFPGDHDQGYVDYLGTPPGVTIYTDLRYAEFSLRQRINLGSGDLCGQCYLDNPVYDGAMIAIGLHMVGDLPAIVAGERDQNIATLASFIRDVGSPVLLRIGYEFDGSWNSYDPALYIKAYRRVMDKIHAAGVTNVASVWQSSGFNTGKSFLLRWYPGDAYVDWVGYSYFKQSNPSGGILDIARERDKPAMIAEATPMRNLSLGDQATHWSTWFQPFFAHIHANQDVIKAVAYINTRWFDQPMWGAGWGDSRVQIRPEIKANWIAEMQSGIWDFGDLDQSADTYVLTPHDLTPP